MEEKILKLKEYFEKEKNVLIAFLFGSFAKGIPLKESDVDIALYLKDKSKREKIWSRLTDEKVGIIKDQSIVVSSPQKEEARAVISQRCKNYNAKLYEVGKDILFENKGVDGIYQKFSVQGIRDEYQDLKIGLLGTHQIISYCNWNVRNLKIIRCIHIP